MLRLSFVVKLFYMVNEDNMNQYCFVGFVLCCTIMTFQMNSNFVNRCKHSRTGISQIIVYTKCILVSILKCICCSFLCIKVCMSDFNYWHNVLWCHKNVMYKLVSFCMYFNLCYMQIKYSCPWLYVESLKPKVFFVR